MGLLSRLAELLNKLRSASTPTDTRDPEGTAWPPAPTAGVPPPPGTTPLGVRNNNPGNIRSSTAQKWRGEIGSNRGFVVFDTAINGIRALALLLGNYERKYGLNTVRAIITRWAPPSENNTAAYIAAVCTSMSVAPDAPLDLGNFAELCDLVHAIIRHENGMDPYPDPTIRSGVMEALS